MRRVALLAAGGLIVVVSAVFLFAQSNDDDGPSALTITRASPSVVTASLRPSFVDPELAEDSCFLIERRVGSNWVDTRAIFDVEQAESTLSPPQPIGKGDRCPRPILRTSQTDFGFEFLDEPLAGGTWRLLYVRTAGGDREIRASAEFVVRRRP